jgi:hypothetical protein
MLNIILKVEKISYLILYLLLAYSILLLSEIITHNYWYIGFILLSIMSVYYFPLLFIAFSKAKEIEKKSLYYVKLASCIILMISSICPAIFLITQNQIINSFGDYVVILNGVFFLICLIGNPKYYNMYIVHFIITVMLMGVQAFS